MFSKFKRVPAATPPPKRTTPFQSFIQLLTFIFMCGNSTMLTIIIISGAVENRAIERLFWLKSDTSGIPNAPDVTKWTFWGIKSVGSNDSNSLFYGSNMGPAYPISPVDNFHTRDNIPHGCIKHRNAIYYMSRCSFAFFWISLSFMGIGNLIYVMTLCSYQFAKVNFLLITTGFVFNICAACVGSAAAVIADRAFHGANRKSEVGAAMFGLTWASALLAIFIMISVTWQFFHARSKYKHKKNSRYTPITSTPEPSRYSTINSSLNSEKNNKNYYNSRNTTPARHGSSTVQTPSSYTPSFFSSNNSSPPAYSEKKGQTKVSVYSMRDSTSVLDQPISYNISPTTPSQSLQANRHGFKGMKFFKMRRNHHSMSDDDYNDI
ncbi:hypothetical protein TBLA_0B02040 [Henningerozyma blattae CBS 6284]|uniref:Protein SUR7 n=1 Tax=Henningerozyma blattae (strain ATCC 34711 / CBS 6284 / DSM 70876 / NBRC 10599 / NRRL Y-10934 / UCD 77-7) TaxID=1071380 RepID=I2GY44_HENB6|nr:hypothetical protein TBLA_0B02040 [Tetrapisispora blattae CBS 6284]CCH59046.1 hypothetical protein TBLA_0B02040 [Tetrapisispora blattae CBS 6284]